MISVALLGFGVIGSGTAEVLTQNKALIEAKLGSPISIKYILDLRDFPDSPFASLVVHDVNIILNDPEVDIVVEMMGGLHPAYDFSRAALEAGKHVVTSNKAVVAAYGEELLTIAEARGLRYLFEASVGGGIPIIRPLCTALSSCQIQHIEGILNGTTNFILSQMAERGVSFETALAEAQRLGYAEQDPSADVDGWDTARKICILAALATGKMASLEQISVEGITRVTAADMENAAKAGYAIRLIGRAEIGETLRINVAPRLVPAASPLATIRDVFNGILVGSDFLGDVMFYGQGAGSLPTASAVVADILDIAGGTPCKPQTWHAAQHADIAPADTDVCGRYLSINASAGWETKLQKVFGDIKPIDTDGHEIALIADPVSDADFARALTELESDGITVISSIRLL
ncbi:MAG: homoserine dehydrogenase [Clostridia bacterium]|nr:homoserine dehydrogenase [Clostridia bacterium]